MALWGAVVHETTREKVNERFKGMKKLLPVMFCTTALLTLNAFAEDKEASASSASAQSQSDSQLSPTGRMGEQVRASQILRADVKDQSGQSIGKIEDIILNPSNGRAEFAIVSASGISSSASTTDTSTATTSVTTATSTSTGEKLYPVPFRLLKTSGSATSGQIASFTLNIEKSKLAQAPSFDRNSWPSEMSSWNQRIYSHFGVSQSGRGGADYSPGGVQQGTERESSQTQSPGQDSSISPPAPPSPQKR
jgi:sporulation protein YlmC with PRC-barrel domain